MIELIYIGHRYYEESGSFISSIYLASGERFDYGLLQAGLRQGEEFRIRQATDEELAFYEERLEEIKSQVRASGLLNS